MDMCDIDNAQDERYSGTGRLYLRESRGMLLVNTRDRVLISNLSPIVQHTH